MSKRKLLLADDSETVQKVVNLTFELEGIEVITFGDGDSAMEQFSAVAPDVVLADVNMPGMSGYDICQNIKADEATKNTPVILLVGSFEPFDEEKAMQVGADDYLTKPFQSIRQLVSKVNELLSVDTDSSQINSFDETLRMEESPYSKADFSDPGMDDEMIQTNQIGSQAIDETAKFETQSDIQDEETDISKTQPLSDKDWRDIYSTGQPPEDAPQTVYELADEQTEQPKSEEIPEFISDEGGFEETGERINVDSEPVSVDYQNSDEQSSEVKLEEDFGLQPDDIDHFYKEPDYDDEEQETAEMPGFSPESEQPQFSETDPSAEIEETDFYLTAENLAADSEIAVSETIETTIEFETETEQSQMSSPVPVLDFDELDLLEIPIPETIETYKTEETFEPDTPQTEFSAPETAVTENETEQVKSEVTEQFSGVNLSPADIDAIAEKVVEKLNARLKE